MPSERAKENKTLSSHCAGCGKSFSTEMLRGMVEGSGPERKIVPLCDPCLAKGWPPPAPEPPAAESPAPEPSSETH
jgi:hypothetical protein